jgi:hypothetical protein
MIQHWSDYESERIAWWEFAVMGIVAAVVVSGALLAWVEYVLMVLRLVRG